MRRAALFVALVALAGCGNSGIEGTLEWVHEPSVSAHALNGQVRNMTSHSVALDSKAMRLLDDRGRKVPGRISVGAGELAADASTRLGATWASGKPVRIDYGAGTLALPSD